MGARQQAHTCHFRIRESAAPVVGADISTAVAVVDQRGGEMNECDIEYPPCECDEPMEDSLPVRAADYTFRDGRESNDAALNPRPLR